MSKKILIAGYYGFENVGDDAVLTSMIDDFRNMDQSSDITVFSNNPEITAVQYHVTSLMWNDFRTVCNAVSNCDMLIIGGGGLYNCYFDYPSEHFLKADHSYFSVFIFGLPILAAIYQRPCMVFGVGASEILAENAKEHIGIGLSSCDAITLRDSGSKAILSKLPYLENTAMIVTADPVFRLKNKPLFHHDDLIKETLPRPIMAVSLRNWSFYGDTDNTENIVADSILEFNKKYGGSVIFLSFDDGKVVSELSYDSSIFNRVASKIGSVPHKIVGSYIMPNEASAVIADCDITLAMRLHPIIMSIKNAVPVVALEYDSKVKNMLVSCELENQGLDLANISLKQLLDKLSYTYENREVIKKSERNVARKMSLAGKNNVDMAMSLLQREYVMPERKHAIPVASYIYEYIAKNIDALSVYQKPVMEQIREAINGGEWEICLKLCEEYSPLYKSHYAEMLYDMAFCYQNLNDFEMAEKHYKTALDLGFSEYWVRYNRGLMYFNLKEDDKAREDLEIAFGMERSNEGLSEVLQLLNDRKPTQQEILLERTE